MPHSLARRRLLTVAAAALLALGVFLVLTALRGSGSKRTAQPAPQAFTPLATYSERVPHVLSTLEIDSAQGVVRGAPATPPSNLPPVSASAFSAPIARYRAYASGQLDRMEGQVARLEQALAADDRAAARVAWRAAFARYLRLGAVYLAGDAATLNQAIDGTASGLPGGVANPQFTGLHRIEYGLWTAVEPRTLLAWVRRLDRDVRSLRGKLGSIAITPLEYATRAHEILEDAARDQLSGADVPWSGEGVLATDAGLDATEAVLATLRPLLKGRENVNPTVGPQLAVLRSTLASLAAAHGGRLPANDQLTQRQSESLDGALGGALEALAQVPGALETEPAPQIPPIPQRDIRIDP